MGESMEKRNGGGMKGGKKEGEVEGGRIDAVKDS